MASKRHIRRRSCEWKRSYATENEVWRAGRLLQQAKPGYITHPYRCQFCHLWHHGRATAAKKRSMRAKRG